MARSYSRLRYRLPTVLGRNLRDDGVLSISDVGRGKMAARGAAGFRQPPLACASRYVGPLSRAVYTRRKRAAYSPYVFALRTGCALRHSFRRSGRALLPGRAGSGGAVVCANALISAQRDELATFRCRETAFSPTVLLPRPANHTGVTVPAPTFPPTPTTTTFSFCLCCPTTPLPLPSTDVHSMWDSSWTFGHCSPAALCRRLAGWFVWCWDAHSKRSSRHAALPVPSNTPSVAALPLPLHYLYYLLFCSSAGDSVRMTLPARGWLISLGRHRGFACWRGSAAFRRLLYPPSYRGQEPRWDGDLVPFLLCLPCRHFPTLRSPACFCFCGGARGGAYHGFDKGKWAPHHHCMPFCPCLCTTAATPATRTTLTAATTRYAAPAARHGAAALPLPAGLAAGRFAVSAARGSHTSPPPFSAPAV